MLRKKQVERKRKGEGGGGQKGDPSLWMEIFMRVVSQDYPFSQQKTKRVKEIIFLPFPVSLEFFKSILFSLFDFHFLFVHLSLECSLPRLFVNVCARIIFVCTPPPNLSHLLVGAARTVTPPPNVKLRDLSLSLRLLLPLHPFAPFPPPL